MKQASALLLMVLLGGMTHAQPSCSDVPACNPATEPDRTKCAAEMTGSTQAGRWVGWWWKDAPNARWCPYSAQCLNAYCTGPNVLDVIQTIRAQGIAAAQAAFGVKPAAGSRDEYDYQSLLYAACQALAASTPTGNPATCNMPPPALPAGWVVDVGTDATKTTRPAYPVVNGARGSTSTARASSGQPCKPEVAQSASSTPGTVYAAFGPSFSPALVALCRKQ